MTRNKREAKAHAYKIAADHLVDFARSIIKDASNLEDLANRRSEVRIGRAMLEIVESLRSRGKSLETYVSEDSSKNP